MAYTFIVSDESVNIYGTIIKTQGIETKDFLRNPVMYFNHNRDKGVIGRWENLRRDGNTLLADAVFDTRSELGAKVARQVQDGFLRSASVGFEALETETVDDVTIITHSKLREISIVDMPANTNAVKLSIPRNKIITLGAPIFKDLRSEIIRLLGMSDTVSDMAILEEIKRLINESENITELSELPDIDKDTRKQYRLLYKSNRRLYDAMLASERENANNIRKTLITNAVREGRISYAASEQWHKMSQGIKTDTLAFILSILPKKMKINQFINGKMTLEEYARYDPETLQKDPELLKRLIEEAIERHKGINTYKSLDWYRKNDPKFLQDNPEIYKRMIEEEIKKKRY